MHKERETYACTHTHKEKERWGREKEREEIDKIPRGREMYS